MTKIQQDVFDTEAELAEHEAILEEMSKRDQALQASNNVAQQPGTNNSVVAASTNNVLLAGSTNAVAQQSSTNEAVKPAGNGPVPPEIITAYKRVCDTLDTFRSKEQMLLITFLPENSQVKDVRAQIVSNEKLKKKFEEENPGLVSGPAAVALDSSKPADPNAVSMSDWNNENTRIVALQRKIQVLTNHLGYIQGRIAVLDANADSITQLERTRKLELQNYEYYLSSLENTRIDEAFGPGKGSNINTIQNPSPPSLDNSKMTKAMAGLAVMGILVGLGLAFLVELYIDHTLKRPADIESRLGVPLFLSIPYRNGHGKTRLLKEAPKTVLALRSESTGRAVILNGGKTTIGRDADSTVPIDDGSLSQHHCEIFSRNGETVVKDLGSTNGTFVNGERIVETTLKPDQRLRVGNVEFVVQSQEMIKDLVLPGNSTSVTPPWDPRHALRPFYDTLRDRLITYFEVKNLTHNPKLVALTSCGDRAGVTSTAAGLAAALSETGEGNVLLVDMNVERGAAHHFYKGHLSCGIDEALTKDKRHEARVQENLYVVTESSNEDSLPRVLPKRFNSLVSKLKASDFDYIIFDMPPMSQISITPRLARFMDMVMVVVESEKTDRDVVQRAVNMLTDAKANVGVVLNKRKHYVPKRLLAEL
jgi:pSer/pThr/pTyr-binding forkhead associated (FHA) protein